MMNDAHTLILKLQAAKLARRRHFLIAQYLANRLQVTHEESQLALVLGSGKEDTNLQAITHWVSSRVDDAILLTCEFEDVLEQLEAALLRTLVDRLPTS